MSATRNKKRDPPWIAFYTIGKRRARPIDIGQPEIVDSQAPMAAAAQLMSPSIGPTGDRPTLAEPGPLLPPTVRADPQRVGIERSAVAAIRTRSC